MRHIRGVARNQALLFPETIDEYITEDNPVRFIDAFVESLDLAEMGFERVEPAETGRPPYDPSDLLKLYIYGYLNRIRSSRRLEEEAGRNVEVMWLLGKLRPDFKTIADFRRDNVKAFKHVFREFTLVCGKLDLFGKELVAIDGSKFKAVNSKGRNFTRTTLKKKIEEIDEKVGRYLAELDKGDEEEKDDRRPTAGELREKIVRLKERRERYMGLERRMEESGESQVSLTDSDSRAFPEKFKVGVGYNVQTAVDGKHHLIVAQDVTNAVTDIDELSRMAIEAKGILGAERLKVLADAGYCNAREVKACEDAGIEAYTPRILTSSCRKRGLYGKEQFRYDKENDCYYCPAGKKLTYRFEGPERRRGKRRVVRYYVGAACGSCRKKRLCTETQGARRITRCPEEDAIDRMLERMRADAGIMKKRKQLAEHPLGTIKFWNQQYAFLMRGLGKVRGEFSLSALAYNIKRATGVVGVGVLIQAVA